MKLTANTVFIYSQGCVYIWWHRLAMPLRNAAQDGVLYSGISISVFRHIDHTVSMYTESLFCLYVKQLLQ